MKLATSANKAFVKLPSTQLGQETPMGSRRRGYDKIAPCTTAFACNLCKSMPVICGANFVPFHEVKSQGHLDKGDISHNSHNLQPFKAQPINQP
jgi:hypothetical protein